MSLFATTLDNGDKERLWKRIIMNEQSLSLLDQKKKSKSFLFKLRSVGTEMA